MALGWVEASAGPGARVVRSRRMRLGIASSVHAVDIVDDEGRLQRLVLKICVRDDPSEPDQAGREATILRLVGAASLPVPRLLAVDREGASCGMPALLMTRLDGHAVLRPRRLSAWIRGLAELLPRIHSIPANPEALGSYETYGIPPDAAPPPSTSQPEAWLEAIARVAGPHPEEPACFIHRDFHPGNVLWVGARTSGVVDWLQGCWGPPAADVGHCRWNLWYLHGREAADAFLAEYRHLAPHDPPYDPYWDLAAALGGHSLRFVHGDRRSLEVAEEIVAAAAARQGLIYSTGSPNRAPSLKRT